MISKFNDFEEEYLLESIINESVLYFSPKLRSMLSKIESPIASELLGLETEDIKPDITFVDFDKDDYLTFTTSNRAKKEIELKHPHLKDFVLTKKTSDIFYDKIGQDNVAQIWSKSRNQIKLGRLVSKIFQQKYSNKEVEDFINKFKANVERLQEKFLIVEANEIEYWYDSSNYKEETGSLGSSCMRDISGIFSIYTDNSEVCKMLILVEDGKLIGRALLWKASIEKESGGKIDADWFMDRQYTIADSYVEKFKNYAKEQNWAFKTHNNHHSLKNITYKNETLNVNMFLQCKKLEDSYDYKRYPYLDTFRRYDPKTGRLYNDSDNSFVGCYILDRTDGTYVEIEEGNWSEYYQTMIPRDRCVYSEPLGDYIYEDQSIVVRYGRQRHRGYWPEDSDDIVWSDYYEHYYHVDDTVYSEHYQTYIPEDRAVSVISEIYKSGKINDDYFISDDDDYIPLSNFKGVLWYEELCEIDNNWKIGQTHVGILSDILVKNYENKWIPEVFKLEVFETISGPKGINFLTPVDSKILDIKIKDRPIFIMDKFEYKVSIENIIDDIKKKSIEKLKSNIDVEIITKRLKEIESQLNH